MKVTSNIVVSLVLFFRLGISKREWFVYECSWLGALDAINLLAAYNISSDLSHRPDPFPSLIKFKVSASGVEPYSKRYNCDAIDP